MITIKEMISKKELNQYVKFPFKLYKNNKYWVPPIINEEIESFDKNINPVFQHAEARFFVAEKNNEIVFNFDARTSLNEHFIFLDSLVKVLQLCYVYQVEHHTFPVVKLNFIPRKSVQCHIF